VGDAGRDRRAGILVERARLSEGHRGLAHGKGGETAAAEQLEGAAARRSGSLLDGVGEGTLGAREPVRCAHPWPHPQAGGELRPNSAAAAHGATVSLVSFRSCEFGPTMIVNSPGSTTRFMSRFHRAKASDRIGISTCRVSPGSSVTRWKPTSSLIGRVTELISSRR